MGFMTEVSILNDRLHEIQQHPETLVEDILQVTSSSRVSQHGRDGVTIHPSHHADDPVVYLAWHNAFINFARRKNEMTTAELQNYHRLACLAHKILTADRDMLAEALRDRAVGLYGCGKEDMEKTIRKHRRQPYARD